MYRHIGAGKTARDKDIVGIFDLDGHVTPDATAAFLRAKQQSGKVGSAGDDLPKSFVLLTDGTVVLSHISSSKLSAR